MVKYSVKIDLSISGNNTKIYDGVIAYRASTSKMDKILIRRKNIIITVERSKPITNLALNRNSTINKEIIKGLCLYYFLIAKPSKIKKITIDRVFSKSTHQKLVLEKETIKQVFHKNDNLNILKSVKSREIDSLLLEDPIGKSIFYAATHFAKSQTISNPIDRFEKLWKTFNSLYKALSKAESDRDCLCFLRKHIEDNSSLYPLSLSKANTLTSTELQENKRWNLMILNNYNTQKLTKSLVISIMLNKDFRVLELYKSKLPIREVYIKANGEYPALINFINSNLTTHTVRNSDVLSVLCLKYLYFVRNKITHAEKADHGFSFLPESSEEKEIQSLLPLFELLIIDMLNFCKSY